MIASKSLVVPVPVSLTRIFAKGIVRQNADNVRETAGLNTAQLPEGVSHEVIHTDDLVILP